MGTECLSVLERIIIQWDSECAIAEREVEHQAVNPITLSRKM